MPLTDDALDRLLNEAAIAYPTTAEVVALVEEVQRLRAERRSYPDNATDFTYTGPPESRNGFVRTLLFYSRGPGDPPGNQEVWMCAACDQTEERGHAPDCPEARDAS